MPTTLEPTGDRLLVLPVEESLTLKSGLVLPEGYGEKPHRGRIVALGPNVNGGTRIDTPLDLDPTAIVLAVDDEVLYSKYGGTELKVDGQELILLRESDVFCRVTEDVVDDAVEE